MVREYTVTVPDEQAEWLDDQPHLNPSGLLQKAIRDQRRLETTKRTQKEQPQIGEVDTEGTPDPNARNDNALKVAKAYPNDAGRGIIRLDPDTLRDVEANPGDVIEITGRATTGAKGWRADRQDWSTKSVRIDQYTRQNAEIGIGEHITIQKAEPKPANRVLLTHHDEATSRVDTDAVAMIKRQLLKQPVVERDVIAVMSSTNHPFIRSPSQAIPLIAIETDPTGVVVIADETTVELQTE